MYKTNFFLWFFLLMDAQIYAEEMTIKSENKITYTVQELIESARKKNYDIRANAEKVYRARQRIRVAMGRLLPSLNFGTVMAGVQQNYFDLVPSLLGFLFPANWFRWKESRLFFQAERRNYAVMIANEINAVQSLAYRIHSLISLEQIYVIYLDKVGRVVKIAKKRAKYGEDAVDITLELENIELRMQHDLSVLRNNISRQLSELANSIALDLGKDWDQFHIAPVSLPDLYKKSPLSAEDMIDDIMEKSMERKALSYLFMATKYSKYNRSFQFLSPNGDVDGSFGFGYFAYVNIGKSSEREIKIKQEELDSNLLLATRKAVADYNASLDLYDRSIKGFNNAKDWYEVLVAKFEEGGSYDPMEYMRAFESLLAFHSRLYQAQHYYLISNAQIDRLRWNCHYYRDLLHMAPSSERKDKREKKGISRISRWIHSLKRKMEDRDIKNDLKRHKISV
ncbi:MAG: hypothetical protein H6618_07870 [Deltaproteobacteria bacterium]|nr:hypothetical protein [Deltaproteobacteria bacterium]